MGKTTNAKTKHPQLTLRALNRALLERQHLLTRSGDDAAAIMSQVGGLQAQAAAPPFIGLWARQEGFEAEALRRALVEGELVRATLMRATIQMIATREYGWMRPALQGALTRSMRSIAGSKDKPFDLEEVVAAGYALFGQGPLTFAALRDALIERFPDHDERLTAYALRMQLPLHQVADQRGRWAYASIPHYKLAPEGLDEQADMKRLVRAYLRAFGPASVADAQRWSGAPALAATFEAMGDELVRYTAPNGRTVLHDLASMTLPDEDTPAPVRLIPEYDNLIIGHEDRTRVIEEAARKRVFLTAARVRATVLVDGFVVGAWRHEAQPRALRVTVEPFVELDAATRAAIEDEAARLKQVWPEVEVIEVDWE